MERGIRYRVGGRSLRSRWSLALALGAGFALAFALPAQAVTDTLDQSQSLTTGSEASPWMAQTFTAGMTGQLDRVSLATYLQYSGSGTVAIQSVTGAFPAGTTLGTTFFSGVLGGNKQLHDFTFTPAVPVNAGSQYAIVVKISAGRSGYLTWYGSHGNADYAGGQLYVGYSSTTWKTDPQYGGEFAFQTWVIGGSSNQAPTVAADNQVASANEGTSPTNTGTFSDADGDAVALTASAGTVTQTGTSSGTWSWTEPASDEAASQAVTIKADDGHGFVATAPFTAVIKGVKPTVTISLATTSSPEGTAVNLNGSASSPWAQDNTVGFTYSWSVTKQDGTSFGTGTAAGFSFTPTDEGTYVATLNATDDGGQTGTSSVTITGTNVAPSATITSVSWTPQLVLTAHETVNFGGTFIDPGTLDTHTASWNFGDGTSSPISAADSVAPSASHSYGAPGAYAVTLTVIDDDNGAGQATTTVTVQTPQQALTSIGGYVQGLKGLNGGQKNSLIAKLDAAGASITRGNATAATNQLNAFLNELQTDLNAGRISNDDMTALRGGVNNVQAALGTYNRFLTWIGSL
jgi:hypothetical protein